ncbi:SusD/RagB family nutrient-binding outer membrane lipoprotein [Chryseobacterium gwangjuense]|uniref:SusD/RagB family nutrient-binding outer membrane lipoprotein n=1 Tax=Chryseobacterium gwangjuense TaxID=1069980 RepID=UPI001E31C659|nr:SusD/RagB family nutrient-binding outer membrane lipoprotein [Chryseobacterium gwangjuense]MCE3076673.1 SusD/RagB family nutrient-binding outer membrane lipoprotein [Chryseobacterium gwangjuense]
MKKILIPVFGATLLFFNSCSNDYIDVNNDPNNAYNNQLTPKNRLAAAETTIYATQAVTMNRFGNLMMNAWAGNIYRYASPFSEEYQMIANSTFYNEIWDNLYLGVSNYQDIIDSPVAAQYPHHVAIAKIMKAYYMQMIVDLYNNVPYTQAFKAQNNLHPKYDQGKDVYKGLMDELNQALVLLNQTPANSSFAVATTEDPIFSGTMNSWKQMANTVKLKMLVRLSNTTDAGVKAWRDAELTAMAPLTSSTANFISADVRIQPGYLAASGLQNPYYGSYSYINLAGNDYGTNFQLVVGSEHMINTMKGTSTGVVDTRMLRLFVANGLGAGNISVGNYKGQPQGGGQIIGDDESDYATLGLFGTLWGTANPTTGSSAAGYVLPLSEVRFLQAEAATVYPTTMAFNAQTVFNDGITQSFTTFGNTAAQATAYLAAIAAKPGMGWAASTNKIEAIQYQKWIALTNLNPTETYISSTKTGYPVLPMPIGSYKTLRPKRLMYPQSEYISNSANVPTPSIDQMYDATNQYAPFWLK